MASPVKTTVTELPESRVRVDAEVPAAEVERSLAQAARRLARDTRVPGFRKGKVPPPVFIRRVGREYVLDEAVRGSIGGWYADAIGEPAIAPIGEPKLDLGDLPRGGRAAVVLDRDRRAPDRELGDYLGPRGRQARAGGRRGARRARARAPARAARETRDGRARRRARATSS